MTGSLVFLVTFYSDFFEKIYNVTCIYFLIDNEDS